MAFLPHPTPPPKEVADIFTIQDVHTAKTSLKNSVDLN